MTNSDGVRPDKSNFQILHHPCIYQHFLLQLYTYYTTILFIIHTHVESLYCNLLRNWYRWHISRTHSDQLQVHTCTPPPTRYYSVMAAHTEWVGNTIHLIFILCQSSLASGTTSLAEAKPLRVKCRLLEMCLRNSTSVPWRWSRMPSTPKLLVKLKWDW